MKILNKRKVATMNLKNIKPTTVFNILNILDFATTYVGIEKAGCVEKNPLIRWAIERKYWKTLFVFKIFVLPSWMHLNMARNKTRETDEFHENVVKHTYNTVNVVFGIVVLNNTFNIFRNLTRK